MRWGLPVELWGRRSRRSRSRLAMISTSWLRGSTTSNSRSSTSRMSSSSCLVSWGNVRTSVERWQHSTVGRQTNYIIIYENSLIKLKRCFMKSGRQMRRGAYLQSSLQPRRRGITSIKKHLADPNPEPGHRRLVPIVLHWSRNSRRSVAF